MTAGRGAALVTGAARRIGAAIAERLVEDGYAVALHASRRSQSDAQTLAARLAARGGRVVVLVADLGAAEEAGALIARARDSLGTLCVLVNNASVFEPDRADDFDLARWERHFAVNLRAPAMLARDFAAQAQGVIGGAARGVEEGGRAAGPPGAVVGGAVGAVTGGVAGLLGVDQRPRFRQYVTQERVPSYRWSGRVAVGATLPVEGVTYYEVAAE